MLEPSVKYDLASSMFVYSEWMQEKVSFCLIFCE